MKKFLSLAAMTGCIVLLFSGCFGPKNQESIPASEENQISTSPITRAPEANNTTVKTADELAEIQAIIADNQNVVVDFFATWCGPCMYMSPIIDQLAAERPDIVFVKVDTDKFKEAFKGFELGGKQIRISGIPSIHLFKDGSAAEEIRGSTDKTTFVKILDANFVKKS